VVAAEASGAALLADGRSDLDEDPKPGAWLGQSLESSRRAAAHAKDAAQDAGVGGSERRHGSAASPSRPAKPRPAGAPPPPPAEIVGLLDGLADADAFEVDRRLRRAVRLERTHEARIGPLLRRVLDAHDYRRRGYWDRDRYLEERLGMCPRKARALVRIERLLARAPALLDAYRSGRLSWLQIQALSPLLEIGLDPEPARAWVQRAARVTLRRLEDDVRNALARADLAVAESTGTSAGPEEEFGMEGRRIGAQRGRERRIGAQHRREDATVSFHAPAESARFFRAVLEAVRERLAAARGAPATQGEAFEWMLDHAIGTWSQRDERARLQHGIFERDGWRCAVPGCSSYRNLQVHHIVFRSQGGGDEPENLITLCAWHHQRGVHGGLVRITGRAPDRLRFELGLREGEAPLAVYDSQERLVGGSQP
jgi:hypothetical protein